MNELQDTHIWCFTYEIPHSCICRPKDTESIWTPFIWAVWGDKYFAAFWTVRRHDHAQLLKQFIFHRHRRHRCCRHYIDFTVVEISFTQRVSIWAISIFQYVAIIYTFTRSFWLLFKSNWPFVSIQCSIVIQECRHTKKRTELTQSKLTKCKTFQRSNWTVVKWTCATAIAHMLFMCRQHDQFTYVIILFKT